MTTANKDLPALPEPDSTACDYLRGIIKYHSATQVREILRAALARPEPASTPVAVEGYALVPKKLTAEMIKAGGHVNSEWLNDNAPIGEARYAMPMEGVWSAMLNAAPQGQQSAASGLISMIVDRDTAPDGRHDVVDCDIRGNPITREMAYKADPSHECILREGDMLTCTACGTTTKMADPYKTEADPAQEAGRNATLEEAALLVMKLNAEMVICRADALEIAARVRALKTAPAQPAVDLVAAIEALPDIDLFDPDVSYDSFEKGLYYRGARDMRNAAAALARAQLEGK